MNNAKTVGIYPEEECRILDKNINLPVIFEEGQERQDED